MFTAGYVESALPSWELVAFCAVIAFAYGVIRAWKMRDAHQRRLRTSISTRVAYGSITIFAYLIILVLMVAVPDRFAKSINHAIDAIIRLDFFRDAPLLSLVLLGLSTIFPMVRAIERTIVMGLHKPDAPTSSIFINYRRGPSSGMAGRLFDHLRQSVPETRIFMDVDALRPGVDFDKALAEQVAKADVFLSIIDQHWLDHKDEFGRRRLESDADYVRREIATALERNVLVIPVLLDGSQMPRIDCLPEDIRRLVHKQAVELRHNRFNADAAIIIDEVRAQLGLVT